MSRELKSLRIQDKLDSLYRRQEIIANQHDETFFQEELKEIEDDIDFLNNELTELFKDE